MNGQNITTTNEIVMEKFPRNGKLKVVHIRGRPIDEFESHKTFEHSK